MSDQKKSLFGDAVEMMEIFRSLPEAEKAIAIAYVMGRSSQPLNKIVRVPDK